MEPEPTPAPAPAPAATATPVQPKLAVIQEARFTQNAPGEHHHPLYALNACYCSNNHNNKCGDMGVMSGMVLALNSLLNWEHNF